MAYQKNGAWLLIISGLVIMLLGADFMLKKWRFNKDAVRSNGTVVKINTQATTKGRKTVYAPVVLFTTESGKEVMFSSRIYHFGHKYNIGDTIKIIYSESSPEQAFVDEFQAKWGGPLFFLITGLAALITGCLILRNK